MRKIKWENIVTIIMVGLWIMCMVHHIKLNGLYKELIIEVIIYSIFTIMGRYIAKDIRKNPSNWTL